MSADNEMDVLFPGLEVTARGEKITLRPFFFGEFPRVMKIVHPLLSTLGASGMLRVVKVEGPSGSVEAKLSIEIPTNLMEVLSDLMLSGSPALMDLTLFAVNCGLPSGAEVKDASWLNALPIDEGIRIVTKWFEVNSDFFVRRVLPMFPDLLEKTTTEPQAGSTSSPS